MRMAALVTLVCCLVATPVLAGDNLNVFLSQTGSMASGDPHQTDTGMKLTVDNPEKFMNLTGVTNIKKGDTVIVTFKSETMAKVEIPSQKLEGTLRLEDGNWKPIEPFKNIIMRLK